MITDTVCNNFGFGYMSVSIDNVYAAYTFSDNSTYAHAYLNKTATPSSVTFTSGQIIPAQGREPGVTIPTFTPGSHTVTMALWAWDFKAKTGGQVGTITIPFNDWGPLVTLTATPTSFTVNNSPGMDSTNQSYLQWTPEIGATSCTGSATGPVAVSFPTGGFMYYTGYTSGAETGILHTPGTYTYSISCANQHGYSGVTKTATVTVTAPPTASLAPLTVHLGLLYPTADPGGVDYISWSSTGAASCSAGSSDGSWSGSQALNNTYAGVGTLLSNINPPVTYRLTCTSLDGQTAYDTKTVMKSVPAPGLTYDTIAISNNTCGSSASNSGSGLQPDGIVTVTENPAPGYTFTYWSDSLGNNLSSSNPYSFHLTGLVVLAANCTAPSTPSTRTYANISLLASPAEGGSVNMQGVTSQLIQVGINNPPTTYTAKSYVNSGYVFTNWTQDTPGTGTVVSTSANYAFPVTGDRILYANFVPSNPPIVAFTATTTDPSVTISVSNPVITFSGGNCGLVSASISGGVALLSGQSVSAGQFVTVTATSPSGSNFGYWSDNSGTQVSYSQSYSFSATADTNLTANCIANPTVDNNVSLYIGTSVSDAISNSWTKVRGPGGLGFSLVWSIPTLYTAPGDYCTKGSKYPTGVSDTYWPKWSDTTINNSIYNGGGSLMGTTTDVTLPAGTYKFTLSCTHYGADGNPVTTPTSSVTMQLTSQYSYTTNL